MKNDILITGKKGFIGKQIIGGKSFKGRLSKSQLLLQTNNVIGIVHLAAKSNKRNCINDPRGCIESNLLALCDVLEVALLKNIYVLFISTFQVREKNLYGLSKLFGEELCRAYQKKGLKVEILRLPIVYGPKDKKDKVVTKIINELRNGIKPVIKTKKKFYFAYVDNIANLIERKFDIAIIGKKYSLLELIEGIKRCLKEEK